MKRIPAPLVLLLALAITACASEVATPEPTASATPEPTVAGSAAAMPSFDFNGDPELAARFPDSVAGEPLQIQSVDGATFAAAGTDPVFEEFLAAIGAEATDVSVAFGGVIIGEERLAAGAFRVRGAAEDDLRREFIAASEDAGDVPDLAQETIGSKEVWTATEASDGIETQVFVYTDGDTLYFLTGSIEHATELLEALP